MGSVRILILSEQMRGTSFALTGNQYSIGRAESCDICISDPTISGHHCTLLKLEDERYAVRDENSTNGTKVNEEKVTDQIVPLTNGDILQVGAVEILFDDREDNKQEARTMTVINLETTGTSDISTAAMKNLGTKIGAKKSRPHHWIEKADESSDIKKQDERNAELYNNNRASANYDKKE